MQTTITDLSNFSKSLMQAIHQNDESFILEASSFANKSEVANFINNWQVIVNKSYEQGIDPDIQLYDNKALLCFNFVGNISSSLDLIFKDDQWLIQKDISKSINETVVMGFSTPRTLSNNYKFYFKSTGQSKSNIIINQLRLEILQNIQQNNEFLIPVNQHLIKGKNFIQLTIEVEGDSYVSFVLELLQYDQAGQQLKSPVSLFKDGLESGPHHFELQANIS